MTNVLGTRRAAQQWSDAEWKARVELAACYRLADMNKMSAVIWNHITLRIPGTEHILINRFGLRYDEIRASNLLKITLDGEVLDGTPEELNFTGYVIHGAIHRTRKDVSCVMHTHSRGGKGVAALKQGLLPIGQESVMFYEDVAYHDYEGFSDDTEECDRITAHFGNHWQMIMRNHGLLTAGRNVGEAYWRMYYLEMSCQLQMDVMASGGEMVIPPREVLLKAKHQALANGRIPGTDEWPALVRMVDAVAPDYKT
ncbi:MAG: class II aldolase/adducin family protein [Pseudorhodoplanes sp.]